MEKFRGDKEAFRTTLDDLLANFADPNAQDPRAYAGQMLTDHPELDSPLCQATCRRTGSQTLPKTKRPQRMQPWVQPIC